MQAKTLECQLAQAQLGRYISGEMMSDEAASQLEKHIAACESCRQEARLRKQALQAATPTAVVQVETANPNKKATRINLLESVAKKPGLVKPIVLSSLLVAVLYAMTLFAKDPSRLFGPRLDSSLAASTTPAADTAANAAVDSQPTSTPPQQPSTPPEEPTTPPAPKPTATEQAVSPTKTAQPPNPAPPVRTPAVEVRAETAPKTIKRPARKPSRRLTRQTGRPSGIRVYDAAGNPIGGN